MPKSNNSPLFSPLGSEFIPFHPPEGEKRQHSYCPYLEDKVSSVKTASRKNGCKRCYERKKRAILGRGGWDGNSPIRTPCNWRPKQEIAAHCPPPCHTPYIFCQFLGLFQAYLPSSQKELPHREGRAWVHCSNTVPTENNVKDDCSANRSGGR